MCKAWQDAQEEAAREAATKAATKAAREAAILTAIELWRDDEVSDEIIKKRIMAKYNLSDEEAEDYMLKTSSILV